ncbi:MAG TPA: glycolate oxidase subunit GlcE [Alphaproteobacteria bacterium]|nr:glycolate oxidase subunit GlcE [Alphaproteobacteria bacterium]
MDAVSKFKPQGVEEVAAFLAVHSESGTPVLAQGAGSKATLGRPAADGAATLDLSGLSGITLYEPAELVMTARAGTTLAEIEAAAHAHGQCLAFEPPDAGPLLGITGASPTLGGVVATGWSGPRRVKAGAVRDHILGAKAVGGDGRSFKSGGRVVKNVTGFDLPKLLTGSHGTLAVMTEITIKVVPAPEQTRTLILLGLDPERAIRALTEAAGGPYEISGAAHLPPETSGRCSAAASAWAGGGMTALRLEGFGPSVSARLGVLRARFGDQTGLAVLDQEQSIAFWHEVRDVATLLPPDGILWRLSLPPTEAARTVETIARGAPAEAIYDWGGGLVWLRLPSAEDGHAALVRGAMPSGHATLVRASAAVRGKVPVFQPQADSLQALTRRVKAAFDPAGILGRGRMYSDF